MPPDAPHDQLRRARLARGDDVAALSARTGLRVHHIRAIEEGRFVDLPAGIYARAAVRKFASAYGLDPDGVLADCGALLPDVDDPIDALARARGMAPAPDRVHPERRSPDSTHRLRPFAAAIVDGAVTGALLLAAGGAAALIARVSIGAFGSSAIAFFLVGLILGAAYYVSMGGLSGTTLGEYAVGPEARQRDPRPLTLGAIALRTLAAATADARAIVVIGRWVGRLTRGGARTVPPPAPSPSPPPPPGREEALTWSMSQRASVPPPPLRPRHG